MLYHYRDITSSQYLKKFGKFLQQFEDNLPLDDKYKNKNVVASSPIVAINLAFSGGDVGGPKTAAFNLPNDEQVTKVKVNFPIKQYNTINY